MELLVNAAYFTCILSRRQQRRSENATSADPLNRLFTGLSDTRCLPRSFIVGPSAYGRTKNKGVQVIHPHPAL